jgi:hypothetical protein
MDVPTKAWIDGLRFVLTTLALDAPIRASFDGLKFVLTTLSY